MNSIALRTAVEYLSAKRFPEEISGKYKLKFTRIPSGWIPRPVKTQLPTARKIKGIKHPIVGYFFLGDYASITKRCIERFNPYSRFYQAWFGVYALLDFQGNQFGFKRGKPDLRSLWRSGVADQTSWLRAYRIPNPLVKAVHYPPTAESLTVDGYDAYKWNGQIWTQSDLNPRGSYLWHYNLLFGFPSKKYENAIDPHHKILLTGFYLTWRVERCNTTFIVYACGAEYQTKDGISHDHYPSLERDFWRILDGIRIDCE